jgi:hypothetical protein
MRLCSSTVQIFRNLSLISWARLAVNVVKRIFSLSCNCPASHLAQCIATTVLPVPAPPMLPVNHPNSSSQPLICFSHQILHIRNFEVVHPTYDIPSYAFSTINPHSGLSPVRLRPCWAHNQKRPAASRDRSFAIPC